MAHLRDEMMTVIQKELDYVLQWRDNPLPAIEILTWPEMLIRSVFHGACYGGFELTARWLWDKRNDALHDYGLLHTFAATCSNGQLDTARWLTTICPELLSPRNTQCAFENTCIEERRYKAVRDWLRGRLPKNT